MNTRLFAYALALVFCLSATYQANGQTTIRPPVRELPAEGGGGYILTTGTGAWTAKTTADWISIQPRTSGEAGDSCIYVVRKNTSTEPREANIFINDNIHTVIQYGSSVNLKKAPDVAKQDTSQHNVKDNIATDSYSPTLKHSNIDSHQMFNASTMQSGIGIMGMFHNSSDYNEGYGGAIRYTLDLDSYQNSLRLGLQAGLMNGFTDSWTAESMYRSDKVSFKSIDIMAIYDFILNPSTKIYLGVGGGIYIPSVDISITVSPSGLNELDYFNADVKTDADTTAGYFGLVGIEQNISDNISLFLEIRYLSLKYDVDLTTTSTAAGGGMSFSETVKNTNEYDMSGIGGNLGIVWRF